MEYQLLFTRFLNHTFGAAVTQFLLALHVHPENPRAPITNAFAMEVLCVLVLLVFFLVVRSRLSVEEPGAFQHMGEVYHEFVNQQGHDVIGHGYERFVPFVGALGLFILLCNLLGLVPGLDSPTAYVVVPLGLALPTFLYYNFYGVKENGLGKYLAHFFGPIPAMRPTEKPKTAIGKLMRPLLLLTVVGGSIFMFVIEIISHTARILSLTVRLYANMFAGDMVTLVFFSLIPIGIPIVFLGLHLGVALVQAYVFMLLAMIYLSGATSHDETANA
jgi:F-type H+-transporting ATPase subunit a